MPVLTGNFHALPRAPGHPRMPDITTLGIRLADLAPVAPRIAAHAGEFRSSDAQG